MKGAAHSAPTTAFSAGCTAQTTYKAQFTSKTLRVTPNSKYFVQAEADFASNCMCIFYYNNFNREGN
jgi:hypothetical protein